MKAWASHKSFKPKDEPPSEPPVGRNAGVQWHGERATLCFAGHLLMENRNKTIAGGRQLRYRGRQRNRAWFKMTTAVYNILRITALDTQPA